MSWNRTYRPKKITELHLTSVRKQLEKLIKTKNLPQVFLFAGPKGTGKTSAARILGAVLNEPRNAPVVKSIFIDKKPASESFVEPDNSVPLIQKILAGTSYTVQEMDAASNRGIDNIRELKERIALPPQEGVMTVYILDEAHMLTTEAFNALLKVLEEPPTHVVFILATTELHKIPETIASRCQIIHFSKATPPELLEVLTTICTQEHVTAEPAALEVIAAHADGSFRDAIKYAELATHNSQLTLENVQQYLQTVSSQVVATYLSAVLAKDAQKVVEFFGDLRSQGVRERVFHTSLLATLHQALLAEYGFAPHPIESLTPPIVLFLIKELSDPQLSGEQIIPFLLLEVKSLEIITRAQKKSDKPQSQKQQNDQPNTQPTKVVVKKNYQNGNGQLLVERWHDFVETVAKKNTTFAALLRSARPVSGSIGEITIQVFYRFHQEQLSEPSFLTKVEEFVTTICGGSLRFNFELATIPTAILDQSPNHSTKDLAQLASESLM